MQLIVKSHNKSAPNDSCYRLSKVFPRPKGRGRRGEAKSGAGVNELPGNATSAQAALLPEKVMFVKSLLLLLSELATARRTAP